MKDIAHISDSEKDEDFKDNMSYYQSEVNYDVQSLNFKSERKQF
eukprot:CAMPEP_0202979768 /NCGR_PEP_ID=MMETSP1396-20130829/85840_1 /ASSEMBLY_ACC=CAM_ASM_000872 /TAXON_ID= /ORGANISM="Pseudokeronopsis sp., Strain Brazil" /LENGTH=43 /DNA_ID= /DNA_START= /DNA_END= /DNA_ORIENTATION=